MAWHSTLLLLYSSSWMIQICLGCKFDVFGQHSNYSSGPAWYEDGGDHNFHEHNHEDDDHHNEDNNEGDTEFFYKLLMQNGNVTITSSRCNADISCENWGAWQSWSECHLGIPGSSKPVCHNALRTKRRYCAGTYICYEVNWNFCVHESSCSGKWSAWSIVYDECLQDCENGQKRTRECLAENGDVVSGICLGSGVNERQTEILPCDIASCQNVTEEEDISKDLALYIAVPSLLIIVIIPICLLCKKFKKKKNSNSSTGHVTSASFLVGHWRIISQRFGRMMTPSLPRERTGSRVETEENTYNTIHIYENPTLPKQSTASNSEQSYYEQCSPSCSNNYDIPLDSVRDRTITEWSDTGYSVIGITDPYEKMQPLGYDSVIKVREVRRAQSVDNVILGSVPGRPRQKAGNPMYPPKPRGITQKLPRNAFALSKFTSANYGQGGCAGSISKKKSVRLTNKNSIPSTHSNRMASSIQEDRYGYLVPNAAVKQTATQKRKQFVKVASLPTDVSTYVTMKSPLKNLKMAKSIR